MIFNDNIKEKIEIILGKMPNINNIMKGIEIIDFIENESFYFIDKDGKQYKVGKVLNKIYNLENNQDIIDATIGNLLYNIETTTDPDLIDEIYQSEINSCMQYVGSINDIWETLREKNPNVELLYIYREFEEGDLEYVGRVIINNEEMDRGQIYTRNGDATEDKYAYKLLEYITKDYNENETKYDLNEQQFINFENNLDYGYDGDKIGEILRSLGINEVEEKYGLDFLLKAELEGLIDTEGRFTNISNEIYTTKEDFYVYFDNNSGEIISNNIEDIIYLEEPIDDYYYVDYDSIKDFYEKYKNKLSEENMILLEGYIE